MTTTTANINLYIFNEKRAVYGVGTYIRELTDLLSHNHVNINICVVHLMSDKPQIQTEEVDDIKHLYFPAPVTEQQRIDHNKLDELYFRNVVYLLQLYIVEKKHLIFHLNYNQSGKLAEDLKKKFDCRIVSVVHGFIWCSILSGNTTRFRKILTSENNNHKGNGLKTTVFEWYCIECELFEIVDHIICLSENTRLIMEDDYKINPNKINVIYNGLTDNNSIMNKQTLRQKYHVPDVPIFLFAGRLDDKKGLAQIGRAHV